MSNLPDAALRSSRPTPALAVAAFLWSNGTYAVCVLSALSFLSSPLLFPRWGLCVVLPYLSWTWLARRELAFGAPWPAFSRHHPGFCCLRRYLQLDFKTAKELVKLDASANPQAVFAVFPHGTASDFRILMDGVLGRALPRLAPRLRTLSASVLFRLPVVREMALWTGCVDARRSVAEGLLDADFSVLVVPGGMEEQLRTTRGREIAYLRRRKGFVKLALRQGVPVVPVYVFGSSDAFRTSAALFGLRRWVVRNLGACLPLTTGLWGSCCPLPVRTTVVMGAPLSFVPAAAGRPTDEELDAAHAEFTTALRRLFDEHKGALGYGDRELEVI